MPDENQKDPLTQARIHPRSDEEIAVFKPKASHQEKSSKCLVYVLSGIVIQSTILLVFASVVLRVRTPDLKLRSVTAKNLSHGNATSPSLRVTLVTEVTVRNTNFGYFEFENTTTSISYGNTNFGDAKIGNGRARARETKTMNVTVEVRSNRLSDTKNFSSDINLGLLELSSYAELSGRVQLMNIVKKRKIAVMNCIMTLNLTSGAIQDLLCF